jgi:hypothetical protein
MIDLKNYCKYLIDQYDTIKCGDGGGVMSRLNQFYTEGKIKDVLFKNNKLHVKKATLNIYRNKISKFDEDRTNELNLLTFDEFLSQ